MEHKQKRREFTVSVGSSIIFEEEGDDVNGDVHDGEKLGRFQDYLPYQLPWRPVGATEDLEDFESPLKNAQTPQLTFQYFLTIPFYLRYQGRPSKIRSNDVTFPSCSV